MIDEKNYQEWAMEYIEGTLGAQQRREFSAFLASCPAAAAQIEALTADMPTLQPETVIYPDKELLLRGRKISLVRRQERLQRFGAMASGAAAAAVLFGGLLFFEPGTGKKGPERIAAEAATAYPQGVEALAEASQQAQPDQQGQQAATAQSAAEGSLREIAAATQETNASTGASLPAMQTPATRTQQIVKATPAQKTEPRQPGAAARTDEPTPMHAEKAGTSESLAEATSSHMVAEELLATPAVVLPVTVAAASAPAPTQSAMDTHVGATVPVQSATAQPATARRNRSEQRDQEGRRGLFGELLATLNDISPVSGYKTTEESGVAIGSFIRISKRNEK